LLATLFFYLVGRRHGEAAFVSLAFFAFIGVAQYFVRKFKNAAILPNDLLVLGTAAAVAEQYTYSFDPKAVTGVVFIMAGVCVLSLLHPSWSVQPDDKQRGNLRKDGLMGVASALLCAALVLGPNYMKVFQVQIM
jgi:xanthine/uracil permease